MGCANNFLETTEESETNFKYQFGFAFNVLFADLIFHQKLRFCVRTRNKGNSFVRVKLSGRYMEADLLDLSFN